jgi:hypothetical protein
MLLTAAGLGSTTIDSNCCGMQSLDEHHFEVNQSDDRVLFCAIA